MSWRKHGTSIVLACIAAALAVWLYVDRGTITEGEREKRPKNVLPAFRRDEVSRIEITKGAEKLVLARDIDRDADASWRVESPEPGLADPAAVEQLSSAFEFGTFVRKVDAKAAPTFDSPRASGSLTMGKITYRFVLGGVAPSPEGSSYFKVDGDGVFVIGKELADQLLKGALAYKSRTLVPYLSLDLASLDVHGKGGDVRIERAGDLSFKLAGSGLRASREVLDKLWSAFAEMRAESFTEEDVTDPAFSITMTPKDSRPRGELVVGGPCKDHPDDLVVVRKSPTRLAACAPKGIVEGLSLSASDLADTRLFFTHEDEIEELVISSSDSKIELARKGSGWHARAPFDRDLVGDEVDAANALASAVIRAKGTNVAVASPSEPFTARAHVRVKGGESKEDENVDVGQTTSGAWVVRRAADNARLDVTPEIARRLQPSKSALKGRDVISPAIEAKDVTTLSLRCGVAQDLAREGTQWKLTSPAGYTADQAATLDLVDQIARLRADAWIADADDGSFGFSSTDPRSGTSQTSTSNCTATLGARADGGTRTVKLRLGREGEGGMYAIVDDSASGASPVFLEPRVFRDAIARILVDRSALAVDTSKVNAITLSRGALRVEIRRVADKLTGPDASAVSVESIASALDALRADDVVRLGPPAPDEGFAAPSLDVRADKVHIRFGRDFLRKNQTMVYARVDGVDATFAVARERVDPIRSAL